MSRFQKILLTLSIPVVLVGALAGCSSDEAADPTKEPAGNLTMWVRSGTAAQSQALVDAWNAGHERKIDLTVIPNENYLQKVGTAAGSNVLPDLLTSDGVFTPNYTEKGLFSDITEKVAVLPFKDGLVKAQLDVGTYDGKQFTVPHTTAVSALFQNDVLLRKANIDPAAPVTSLEQLAKNAKAVAALGGDVKGMYLTGNNGGSIGFTVFPSVWASGGEVLDKEGTHAAVDSPEFVGVFDALNAMYKDGSIAPSSREETGATRDAVFSTGNVGYLLGSNSVLTNVKNSATMEVGVKPIPGLTGGESTYVGGDVIGIAGSSEKQASAWEFLKWSLSDETQIDVMAKQGFLLSRTDLAENKYSSADPRIVSLNKLVENGRIPFALKYGETFSDANGPWIIAARAAIFGEDAEAALKNAKGGIDASLKH
ncbi:ABC transporter substrate-binding protein [Paenarthrobacter sp. FR1]|uniref:ABC transporter substrate-binding protein n=1 Tax=Paenarthrobacter sp. FR1 TaxID=3439548 RepID=UPI003DA6C9D7